MPCIFNVKTSNFFWATLIGVTPQIFLVCALGNGLEKIIDKNLKRQKKVASNAARRARLNAIVKDKSLPIEERFDATLKLAQMPRNGAKIRLRNRCRITGRPRAYYRKLGMSRIALRDLASFGQVPGVVKSSW